MSDDKLPESIVVKLFDQAKEANNQNTEAVKDLTHVVNDLVRIMEKQPDLNKLTSVCQNRGHDVEEMKNGIKCIGKTTKKILNKVTIMIATVLITVGLMATSYMVVRNSMEDREDRIDAKIEEIVKAKKNVVPTE